MAGFAFVDDTDLIVTDDTNNAQKVSQKMQDSLLLWHGLLQATGGDLVPDKCFWYLIDFKWERGQWRYIQWDESAWPLRIHRENGTSVVIPRLATSEAHRTLGVRLAPDGNNLAEFAHLKEEALQWKNHMVSAKLTRSAADFGIRQVLLPKLCYPLVAMTFTESQCNEILKPVLQQGLPLLGVNQNFPRAVAHGPIRYQGLNLPNLHMEQLIAHITTLLKFGPLCDDPTGLLIRSCGELLRLEAGVNGPLFQISPHLHVCLTGTWFSQCWHHCVQRGISLQEDLQDFHIRRYRDQTLMNRFITTGYRDSDLAALNQCRMHLHVIFLSDICNGHGMAIEPQFWMGNGVSDAHSYNWPRSHKPGPHQWLLWQQALTCAWNIGKSQQLPIPLGRWRWLTREENGWFTNDDGTQLYQRKSQEWFTFTPIPHRRRTRSFYPAAEPTTEESLPQPLHKATVYIRSQSISVTGHSIIEDTPPLAEELPQSFHDSWQCERVTHGNPSVLIQAITAGKAVAVSDGSYKDHQGAAAWTIEGADDGVQLHGAGLTPGLPEDQSAYRSELFGLWGILDELYVFTREHHIRDGLVVIACDGLSALKKAQRQDPTDPSEAHYDLISAIRHLRKSIPLKLTFEHVKGHQDQGIPTVLSRLASLNVQMDMAAKAKLLATRPTEGDHRIPFEGWICVLEGQRLVKNIKESLRNHLNGKIILNHWAMKERFSATTMQAINWECSDKAMKALPQAQRQWVAKAASKFLPDGKNMLRWGLRSKAQCPCCSYPIEDKDHIFKCPAESAQTRWNQSLKELDQWMQSTRTHPQLRQDIINGLQQWHDQIPSCRQGIIGSTTGHIQDSIGWGLALEGCLALRW